MRKEFENIRKETRDIHRISRSILGDWSFVTPDYFVKLDHFMKTMTEELCKWMPWRDCRIVTLLSEYNAASKVVNSFGHPMDVQREARECVKCCVQKMYNYLFELTQYLPDLWEYVPYLYHDKHEESMFVYSVDDIHCLSIPAMLLSNKKYIDSLCDVPYRKGVLWHYIESASYLIDRIQEIGDIAIVNTVMSDILVVIAFTEEAYNKLMDLTIEPNVAFEKFWGLDNREGNHAE